MIRRELAAGIALGALLAAIGVTRNQVWQAVEVSRLFLAARKKLVSGLRAGKAMKCERLIASRKWLTFAFSMMFVGSDCRFGRLKPLGEFMKPEEARIDALRKHPDCGYAEVYDGSVLMIGLGPILV